MVRNNESKQREGTKELHEIARYEQIAVDIASRIARHEYAVGDKLYGRSVLAGQYNVSPETIRRAVALLQSVHIVQVEAGRGIIVKDREKAVDYVEKFNQRKGLMAAQQEFAELLLKRQALDAEIEQQIKKILSYTSRMATLLPRVDDIYVPEESPLVGKSLQEVDFRNQTGATVLAVERGSEEYLTPKSSDPIRANDILIFVGDEGSKAKVEALVNAQMQ
mgnify:CR=1 FL=1